jgi:TRAP-type transport system periplasmic protein
MNKKLIKMSIILICSLLLMAFSTGSLFAQTTLLFGSNSPYGSPSTEAMTKFAEIVEEKTNGEIIVKLYPANELGGNEEMSAGVKSGAQAFCLVGTTVYGVLGLTETAFTAAPMIFESQEQVHRVWEGELGNELSEKLLKKSGVRVISAIWDRMPRHLSSNEPIWGLEEMKGFRVRTGTFPTIEGFKLLGANPISVPLNEMYLALQQGIADGANLPLDYYYDHSIYEVNDYLNMMYHCYDVQLLTVNEKVFQSLSSEQQQILYEAAQVAADYNNKLTWDLEKEYIQKLQDEGMKLIYPKNHEFRKEVEKNVDALYEILGIDRELNIMERINSCK